MLCLFNWIAVNCRNGLRFSCYSRATKILSHLMTHFMFCIYVLFALPLPSICATNSHSVLSVHTTLKITPNKSEQKLNCMNLDFRTDTQFNTDNVRIIDVVNYQKSVTCSTFGYNKLKTNRQNCFVYLQNVRGTMWNLFSIP